MATDDDLKRSWTGAAVQVEQREVLGLHHPAFTGGPMGSINREFLFADGDAGGELLFIELESGASVTATPYPFKVTLPSKDATGRQDMQVTLAVDSGFMRSQLVAAAEYRYSNQAVPIRATLRTYMTHEGAPKNGVGAFRQATDPIVLWLDAVQVNAETVSGVAGRSEIVNRAFPRLHYNADLFPGLAR